VAELRVGTVRATGFETVETSGRESGGEQQRWSLDGDRALAWSPIEEEAVQDDPTCAEAGTGLGLVEQRLEHALGAWRRRRDPTELEALLRRLVQDLEE
jgi:hypothetical protein